MTIGFILKSIASVSKNKVMGISKPSYLWIETSELCNSKCVTCNIWKKKQTGNTLDYNFLADPLFNQVKYIINSGGEPSLSDLQTILLNEHKRLPNATLQVSTNGILADKVFLAVKAALENGANIDVGISLDGVGEKHDEWRGVKGNFERVDYLINKLSDLKKLYNLNITVGSTLTNQTFEHRKALYGYANKNNIGFMWHWFNQSDFYENQSLTLDNDKVQEALKIMPNSLYKQIWLDSLNGATHCFNCFSLRSFAIIKANGDIAPCLSRWNSGIGNINTASPSTIWKSKNAQNERYNITHCKGCANSWGVGWSLQTDYFKILKYALKEKISHDR